MLNWVASFLSDCSLSVKINDELSSSWTPDLGAGQGRRFSPDLYNISTLTAVLWCLTAFSVGFADDGMDVVSGKTIEECECNAQRVLEERKEWHDCAGLALNPDKTGYMGIGFEPKPLVLDGTILHMLHLRSSSWVSQFNQILAGKKPSKTFATELGLLRQGLEPKDVFSIAGTEKNYTTGANSRTSTCQCPCLPSHFKSFATT